MRRYLLSILLFTTCCMTMIASPSADAIEPVTGLPERVVRPIIERQMKLDQMSDMRLRVMINSLFSPVMSYDDNDARLRKQRVQEVFFANEEIPTREEAMASDRKKALAGEAVASRWFTFLWKDLVGNEERPCFAPELLAELQEKGWADDGGEAFDLKTRRARNLLVFLDEQERQLLPLAERYKFSLLGTGRHAVVMTFKDAPHYVCKVLRNKWAFPHQSISAVFWAHTLRQVIVEQGLERSIFMPDSYLVNVHGLQSFVVNPASINWPALKLNDRNYVVVEKFIKNFPTKAENILKWKAVSPELVRDVVIAIREAGIWDVRPTTVDLIACKNAKGEMVEKAHFSHLECPGRGGYTTADFYQRTPEVTERLAEEGLKGLVKMLPSRVLEDLRVIEVLGMERVNDELVARGERKIMPNELGA